MIRATLTILLISISMPSVAEWKPYADTAGGIAYYDKDRIKKLDNDKKSVWVKFYMGMEKLSKAVTVNESLVHYSYTVERLIYDCRDETITTANRYLYDEDGNLLAASSNHTGLHHSEVVPESNDEILMNIICKSK